MTWFCADPGGLCSAVWAPWGLLTPAAEAGAVVLPALPKCSPPGEPQEPLKSCKYSKPKGCRDSAGQGPSAKGEGLRETRAGGQQQCPQALPAAQHSRDVFEHMAVWNFFNKMDFFFKYL